MALSREGVWGHASYRVEWRDTDASGHHHNSLIMRMVEAVEVKIYRELGWIPLFRDSPRVQQTINFRSLLYFDDEPVTTVRLREIGRSSMTFDFEVTKESDTDSHLVADGSYTTVHLPAGSESSAPWPDALRAVISSRMGEVPSFSEGS